MRIQSYQLNELKFAWCNRLYLRWNTHRLSQHRELKELNCSELEQLLSVYEIHVLESCADESGVLILLSLLPTESVSVCASKVKGKVSKWLRERIGLSAPSHLLGRGYFACTVGASRSDQVISYLSKQEAHHGYVDRVVSPVFVKQFAISDVEEVRLQTAHACTRLNYHMVFSTWKRKGVFDSLAGGELTECWQASLKKMRVALQKISVLPDHVHVAIRSHPTVKPSDIAVEMMNVGQQMMFARFGSQLIRARVERLWQASAYLGTYGSISSSEISAYIQNWESRNNDH